MSDENKAEKTGAIVEAEVLDEGSLVKLQKALDGREELHLDFDKLTGGVLLKCASKAKKDDPLMTVPSLSQAYQAHVAAAAAGLKYDDILRLSAPDFIAVTLRTQSFLNGSAVQ